MINSNEIIDDIIIKNNIFEIVKEKEEFKLIKTLEIKLSDFGASK